MPGAKKLAWWVSVLAHPFILIPALVALVTARTLPPRQAATVVALVVAGAILPMLWIIVRRVRAGAWSDHDVSIREQRTRLYPVAIAIAGATVLLVFFLAPPGPVLRGTVAVLGLIVAASLINLVLKISLHTAFAVFTAVALLPDPLLCTATGVIALAVAWSRLVLRRHTVPEVLGGALLGLIVGVALLVWPR